MNGQLFLILVNSRKKTKKTLVRGLRFSFHDSDCIMETALGYHCGIALYAMSFFSVL